MIDSILNKFGIQTNSSPSSSFTLPTILIALLLTVGLVSALSFFTRLLRVILDVTILPGKSLSSYGATPKTPGKGTWAVVTGATDGIGKEYSIQLAKRGFNIFLASRNPEKLGKVAGEIESAVPGVKTKTQAIDFSSADEKQYIALESSLEGLEIGVLVNNVGKSHDMPVPFVETDLEEIQSIVEININSVLRVTRIIAPGMVSRKRGLILNMGSFGGSLPTPLLSVYSGSKSFLSLWSSSLKRELKSSKIDVHLINAYFVVSNMSKIRKSNFLVPTPKEYVSKVLNSLGRQGGGIGRFGVSTPWSSHAIVDWAMHNVLSRQWLVDYTYDQQVSIRKRALRKAERISKGQ